MEGSPLKTYSQVTDPLLHVTRTRSDAFGRRVQVVEDSGPTTTYTYDALDELTKVTDAGGNVTNIDYDSAGRKKSMDDPDMGVWNYTYNPSGTLASQTDAKGQTISFSYDALDRLTGKALPNGWTSSYVYDASTVPFGEGHRTSMSTSLNGTLQTYTRWEYDARGRTTLVGQSVAGVAMNMLFDYDAADRVATQTYNGEVLTTTYDDGGRPLNLCSSIAGQACYVSGATYTAQDQPNIWTLGNGLRQNWDYETTTARLSALQVGTASTPGSLLNRTFTYDDVDNVKTITDAQWPQTQHFDYDTRDRLTHAWTTATLASVPQAFAFSGPPKPPAYPAMTGDMSDLPVAKDAPREPQQAGGHGLAAPVRSFPSQTGTRIKDITFEGGSLTDATTGADSTTGTVNLETSTPLKGAYSATIPNVTSGYLNENITAAGELYVSFYLRAASFPASAACSRSRTVVQPWARST